MVNLLYKNIFFLNYTQVFCSVNLQGGEGSLLSVTYMTVKLITIATSPVALFYHY